MANVFGVEVEDLEEGDMPVDVIVLVKVMDKEGETFILQRFSDGISPWEAVGMFIMGSDVARKSLLGAFEDDDGKE